MPSIEKLEHEAVRLEHGVIRLEHGVVRFLKDWTLPVAIATGTTLYLLFYHVPQLDTLGNQLAPVFDVIFPLFVFLTLFVTFCKVDFHQLMPHRWHVGVLVAQLLLVLVVSVWCWATLPTPDTRPLTPKNSYGRPCSPASLDRRHRHRQWWWASSVATYRP